MQRTTTIFIGLLALGISQSSLAGKVIIDPKGVNQTQYQQDLADCKQIAKDVSVARRAGVRAAAGAAVGAVLGAAVGNSDTAARTAGAGGVIGGAQGAQRGFQEKDQVVKNCLRNRGYAVLN